MVQSISATVISSTVTVVAERAVSSVASTAINRLVDAAVLPNESSLWATLVAKGLQKREEQGRLAREMLRQQQADQIKTKLTEIQTDWDKDTWPSKLNRQETLHILHHGQKKHRLFLLASLPKTGTCPDTFCQDLSLELPNKLGRFVRKYFPLSGDINPVEFYGDYFTEPIADIDIRRLQNLLAPIPTAILYSSITDYEIEFKVSFWGGQDSSIATFSTDPLDWEALKSALKSKGQEEIEALRAIRRVIVGIYQLLTAFVADWYYMKINPQYLPQLFQLKSAFVGQHLVSDLVQPWIDNLILFQKQQQEEMEQVERTFLKPGRVDYTKLRNLLAEGNWKQADQETTDKMLEVMQKKDWWDVDEKEDLLNFPCADLRIIDSLWLKYSDGKFGFSVQKDILIDCGGTPGFDNDWQVSQEFGDRNGWRQFNPISQYGLSDTSDKWLNFSELTFNLNAPRGHLPSQPHTCPDLRAISGVDYSNCYSWKIPYLAQRLIDCKIYFYS